MIHLKLSNIKIPVAEAKNIKNLVCKQFRIRTEDLDGFRIVRQSVDARKKNNVLYNYQVEVTIPDNYRSLLNSPDATECVAAKEIAYPKWQHDRQPVVVGFGPAGMFAALYLARCGAHPIIIERGERIEERQQSVQRFLQTKVLNPNSNVQFGEGGAGTFSDGKLNTNVNSEFNQFILNEFYQHGAPEEVTYQQNPHVGTDYLSKVVKNIRTEIESLGGEFHFNTIFDAFEKDGEELRIHCNNDKTFVTNHLLLGLGHSARDTIRMLHAHGVLMEPKGFSIGVRMEHLQRDINRMQYGQAANLLPPASYKGVVHLKDRGVYTFCMCPGGTVMASASEEGTIVTNGMSEHKRDKANANSALLVSVGPEDFLQGSVLDGIDYQEKYEQLAFRMAGDGRAPGNLVGEFLKGQIATRHRKVVPSYPHGLYYGDFSRCLPDYAVYALREALPLLDRKLPGIANVDTVLTGVETRSSSPVRIIRNEERISSVSGIYPIGEGAGYAGGIMSAAIDGLKTAISLT
ncbi:MAG: hypothetical protein J6P54_03350 [Bacteroidales bacterium]|nr:hypothetical protein [Bacteroidales bacterium]